MEYGINAKLCAKIRRKISNCWEATNDRYMIQCKGGRSDENRDPGYAGRGSKNPKEKDEEKHYERRCFENVFRKGEK
jgi:hypothetical protein